MENEDIVCNSLNVNRSSLIVKILFLSNLISSKGVYVLLDACRVLKERGLQFVCDFVGGETKEIDRATFEAAVKERDLEGIVCYHGPKYGEEKEAYWRRADIFVFPTFYFNECFPLVLLEAMQWRLPLVSSDEGGIPDIVKDGVNGFVCTRQNVQSLAEALEKLITNPVLRQQMGEQGYQRYQEEFTLEAFERRFVAELKGDD
jgi:glycosyltransferase involved in cell wall biosynthesis